MKNFYLKRGTFAFLLLLVGFTSQSIAQDIRYIDVNPGIGTLNNAINGDTTSTGARVDSFNTVYRLKRVEDIYYISALISNIGYPLTVVAEEGDGPKPYLALKTDGTGSTAEYIFRPKGDLTLNGLHLTVMDDLGAVASRIIRASADDITLTVDDCWFDDAHQAAFRLDNSDNNLFLTNSVFSNIGNPADPDNGRGIDDRGNSIDTLVIEDCTFFNLTHSIFRDGGGHIKYCKVNNSNFVNVGRRGFGFGNIAGLDVTNNIFHNVGYIPQDSGSSQAVFELEAITQELLDLGFTQSINISNNSIFLDTTLFKDYLNDTVVATRLFDPIGQSLIDANTIEEFYFVNVNFEDPPSSVSIKNQIDYQMDETLLVENTPDWVLPAPPNTIYHLDVPFSFNYANSVAAFGATDGSQLGDRNWTASPSVGIADLKQNTKSMHIYPVPATSNVNVEFSIENKALVQVEVYNLSGMKVYTLINEMYPAGSHQVNCDFNGKLNAGIYLLRMKAGNNLDAAKLIVR
ncbi:MAG: T9SS type A sorting domain-containing protein [Bacteroidales bacterium]|nr:T9SS type A sorting domain-containing protein [Bacteroidales bacterium]MCF8391840.1 T9SS type A sorting domain-containing protein [Bacteroidales bacterium]